MQFCCEALLRSVDRGEMVYDAVRGCIQFYVKSAWNELDVYYRSVASYCPYCRTKLHKDLVDELEEVLENEYGIMLCDVNLSDPNTLPEEFRSDEWWKKRGL